MSAPLDLVEDLDLATPPGPAHSPWFWVAAGIGIVLLVLLALRLGKRVKARLTAPIPPDKTALADLAAVEAAFDSLDAREFAGRVSLILRVYIEGRFGLRAPRRSTEEFLALAARSPALDAGQQEWTGDVLRLCDRSKFALADLAGETKRDLLNVVREFVRITTPPPAA
jgi:hypothetical protein